MEPLFDNDWLQEHNLDVLFDLFEEEIERKGLDDVNSNSSSIFGTSPVTSYLYGTSPSLASALDLCDLLYDNLQPINFIQQQHQATANASLNNTNSVTNNNQSNSTTTTTDTYNINELQTCNSKVQQVSQNASRNHITSSITNAMRIKRGLKKGQSEGISLLARPLSSNTFGVGGGCSSSSNNISSFNNKNNSDKTSTKITNFKKTIINNSCSKGGIDINHTKQSRNNRNKHLHHVNYITGCSVVREHAYAVRGH